MLTESAPPEVNPFLFETLFPLHSIPCDSLPETLSTVVVGIQLKPQERFYMETSVQNANPVLDPIVPAIQSHALVVAVTSGMFDAISMGARTVPEIASRCSLDPNATESLASVMVALGYLERTGSDLELTQVSRATLVPGSPVPFVNWLRFSSVQLQAIGQLDRVVKRSGPVDLYGLMENEAGLLTHQRAMAETAKPIATWVADNIPAPTNANRMLDIGGSHGVYSASICQRHPNMRADVVELPTFVELARKVAVEVGSARYCSYIAANVLDWKPSNSYELVFLGNIVHHFSEDQILSIFQTVHSCLSEDGTISIWDLSASTDSPDLVSSCFSLFFYLTSGSKCYSGLEIERMLTESMFVDYQVVRPSGNASHALHVARKRR